MAFSSILRSASNATSGFGNLMINKKPPNKGNIFVKFNRVANMMAIKMEEFNQVTKNDSDIGIFNHDARNLKFIEDDTISFIAVILHIWPLFHSQNIKSYLYGG
jgi:cytidylate kinase